MGLLFLALGESIAVTFISTVYIQNDALNNSGHMGYLKDGPIEWTPK